MILSHARKPTEVFCLLTLKVLQVGLQKPGDLCGYFRTKDVIHESNVEISMCIRVSCPSAGHEGAFYLYPTRKPFCLGFLDDLDLNELCRSIMR